MIQLVAPARLIAAALGPVVNNSAVMSQGTGPGATENEPMIPNTAAKLDHMKMLFPVLDRRVKRTTSPEQTHMPPVPNNIRVRLPTRSIRKIWEGNNFYSIGFVKIEFPTV